MQVTAEQTDPCTLVMDIDVDEREVARAFDSAYREFGRYANVPGFRPGKAPRAILERFVDRERVRERALEKVIGDNYTRAIEEQSVQPYRQAQIEPTDLEDNKPYHFKATIPLEPQVTLGEYTGLTVEKPIFPLADAMVDDRIQRLREDRSRLERVTDRGVEKGDVLIAENHIVMEGEEEAPAARRQLIQVGNNIPGFDEAVLGMMPGDERTFELTYPEDYDEEERRGKRATYTVKLHSISARKLPELDDAFAALVAGVSTVEELRETLRRTIERESAQLSDQVAEQRLLQLIISASTIHFPSVLVEDEVGENLREVQQELRQNNLTYDQYLEHNGITADDHHERLAVQAEMRIRTLLALRQIAIQENLQASDEAIEAEFDRMLSEGSLSDEQYERFSADSRRRLQLANALVQQQLHDFLFAHNKLLEVLQENPPAPEVVALGSGDAQAEAGHTE